MKPIERAMCLLSSAVCLATGEVRNEQTLMENIEKFNSVITTGMPGIAGWATDDNGPFHNTYIVTTSGEYCALDTVALNQGLTLHMIDQKATTPTQTRELMDIRCEKKGYTLQDVDGVLKIKIRDVVVCNNPMC